MDNKEYFESLNFQYGRKINVSNFVDPEYSGSGHWHPFVELLVSLTNENRISINFTEYRLQANDIAIIHAGDLHTLHLQEDSSFYVVQFPRDLLTIMSELNSVYSIIQQYHVIRYDPANMLCDKMIYQIKQIVDLYYRETSFPEVRIYSMLLDFYVALGEYCVNDKSGDLLDDGGLEYKSANLMVEACLYISQNCTQTLSLDDIARHVGLSKSHFGHLFKRYTNMTFVDYLTAERIKKAEELISDPQKRITDVAFESGFSSVSSFNRSFKKIKMISPTEFRDTLISQLA